MPRALDALSDEALGREIWALWHHYFITNVPFTINGDTVPKITNEQLEAILPGFRGIVRVATFNQDTDNESLTGVEKGLRLCGSGNFDRGGRMFRAYFERLDEAKTGRRRQSALARRKRRSSYLHTRVAEMVKAQQDITTPEVLRRLERLVEQEAHLDWKVLPKMDRVENENDGKGVIEWSEPNRRKRGGEPLAKSAPTSTIPHMLSRIRKELGINRSKKSKSH
jgi:hypothetical protein